MPSTLKALLNEASPDESQDKSEEADEQQPDDEEVPAGFMQAVGDLRAAKDDESFAEALLSAIRLAR